MPFKLRVGPRQISIHDEETMLGSRSSGDIGWPSEKELYFLDTPAHQQLRGMREWRMMGTAQPRRHQLLRVPEASHQVA
jgi:hypothetical protein